MASDLFDRTLIRIVIRILDKDFDHPHLTKLAKCVLVVPLTIFLFIIERI